MPVCKIDTAKQGVHDLLPGHAYMDGNKKNSLQQAASSKDVSTNSIHLRVSRSLNIPILRA